MLRAGSIMLRVGFAGFFNTNMLASAMRKSRVGSITQHEAPMHGGSGSGGIQALVISSN